MIFIFVHVKYVQIILFILNRYTDTKIQLYFIFSLIQLIIVILGLFTYQYDLYDACFSTFLCLLAKLAINRVLGQESHPPP